MQDNLAFKQIIYVFFYASLAPKEDLYRYKSRTAFILYSYKKLSRMSVSFWNENPSKLS